MIKELRASLRMNSALHGISSTNLSKSQQHSFNRTQMVSRNNERSQKRNYYYQDEVESKYSKKSKDKFGNRFGSTQVRVSQPLRQRMMSANLNANRQKYHLTTESNKFNGVDQSTKKLMSNKEAAESSLNRKFVESTRNTSTAIKTGNGFFSPERNA